MITLFQHQQQALDLTEGHNRCAYYLDMGLGKTFVGSEKALTLNSRVNLLICQCSKVSDWIDHMVENYAMNHCWMIYDLTNKKEFDWFMAAVAETDNPTRICGVINYELTFRRKILKTLSGFTLMLDEEVRSAKAGENTDLASYEADLESNHRAFQDIQTEAAVIMGVLQEKRINREKIAHAVREIGKILSNQI